MNTTHTTIKATYIGSFSILNIMANSIVIAVIAKYPHLREDRTNLFMLSLMVSDILYGVLPTPLSAVLCSSSGKSVLSAMPYLPNVHILLSRWIATVSLNSLSWVTMCKMIAITKPFTYERYLNSTRCYIIITVIWSIGLMIGLCSFLVSVNWSPHVCLPRIEPSSAADAITDLSFLIIGMAICASIVLNAVPTIAYDVRSSMSGHVDEVYLYSFFIMWIVPWNAVVNSFLFVFLFRNVRAKTMEMMKGIFICAY